MAEIEEKRWDVKKEKEIFREWLKNNDFKANFDSDKEFFVIDNPPVYPSGSWHIGAVAHYTLIDAIARSERMKGKEVIFPFCLDRNGLPVERVVEKKYGKKLHEYQREEFIKLCKEEIDKYSKEILELYYRTGMSADYENTYMTDSPEYRKITQATFIELWKKGLVYEDTRPINWCTGCRTTLADAELEYVEGSTTLHYLIFKVEDSEEELIVATTRPELLAACKAVIYNPKDERYKHLKGKKAIVPLYNNKIPIIPHKYAKIEYGSGLVMICSYGDFGDIELFKGLKLEPLQCIDEFGRMTAAVGKYKGMTVEEARQAILKDLEPYKVKEERVQQRVPRCSRCGSRIEFLPMKEWYVKQLDFLDDIRKIADNIEFHPKEHKRILLDWIDSITMDWPISRARYFATEIPLWKCNKCGAWLVPEPGKYYQPWKEDFPGTCPHCGNDKDFTGEKKVFDTWMDSSISNLYVSGYLRDDALFKKAYPTHMRPQGRDIVRTWLYYTLLRNFQLTRKPAFKHVWITGMGLDEHGKKMSKSKGNIIEPKPVIEKYGADAFRFWAASETSIGGDFRISAERIAGAGKFLTKLWNVARFVSKLPIKKEMPEIKATDRWIMGEVDVLIEKCMEGYDDYNFYIPANQVRTFIWNIYAPHYLEMVKSRAYEGDDSALYTIHESFKKILKLLAPIIPFITYEAYKKIYGGNIHKGAFPEKFGEKGYSELTEALCNFNSMVWKKKKEMNISLKSEIRGIEIPNELLPFKEDLILMHNLK